MDMQNVTNLEITEGEVRTIHDSSDNLLWGRLNYDTKYEGDTYQQTYSGYNLIDLVPITNMQISSADGCTTEVVTDSTLGKNVLHITGTDNYPSVVFNLPQRLESGKFYVLKFTYRSAITYTNVPTMWFAPSWTANNWDVLGTLNNAKSGDGDTLTSVPQSTTWKTTSRRFYVNPTHYSSTMYCYDRICFSFGYNSYQSVLQGKELWLADAEIYEITQAEWDADSYTSKDYEPYTGSTPTQLIPSPNPSFPQDIQVVTGEQTVSVSDGVNSEDFTVDLGSIELAKIGDYQDYIYKSGDDWYVHKENGKVQFDGSENFSALGPFDDNYRYYTGAYTALFTNLPRATELALCTHFEYGGVSNDVRVPNSFFFNASGTSTVTNGNITFTIKNITTNSAFKTWIGANKPIVYYQLATPTDTKITDSTLISELEAIHEWLTRYGYTPTVSGNLPLVINQTNLT